MTIAAKNLAFNMKALRKKKNWKQQDLADAVGITRAAIANIERGKSAPRPATLKKIAAALGANEADLYIDPNKLPTEDDLKELKSAVKAGKELAEMTGGESLEDLSLRTALGVIMNALGFEIPALQRRRVQKPEKKLG